MWCNSTVLFIIWRSVTHAYDISIICQYLANNIQLIEAELRIYASLNWIIIGSDNGVSPVRRLTIIWTNSGILLIGPLATKIQWNVYRNSNIFIQEIVYFVSDSMNQYYSTIHKVVRYIWPVITVLTSAPIETDIKHHIYAMCLISW